MALAWWQSGVVYQVYPRSFRDSDGDGTGDLRGIADRLGHLVWLGVDAVWVSPVYPSPMTDFGYDVADYCGIDPLFGTLEDFDALVREAHRLGLRVILDFVPNHSSDQHPWFGDSRRRADGKEDWYLWRDGAPGGGPPNNWLSHFGGPAWTFDAVRGQWYCHSFLPTQPDLNWRNGAVRAALLDALRFWLARGVDGFRVDVMWLLIKDDQFLDNPANPDWTPGQRSYGRLQPLHNADRPEVHDAVAAMRAVLDEHGHDKRGDKVLIGEIYLPIDRLVAYYGRDGRGAHLPYNFHLLLLQDWTASKVAALIREYEAALPPGGWPNWGWATTTGRASRAGSARRRPGSRRCCCSRCAARPRSTWGTSWGCWTRPFPPTPCATRRNCASRAKDRAATPCARRSHGRADPAPGSRRGCPGCRSARTCRSTGKGPTRTRWRRCTAG